MPNPGDEHAAGEVPEALTTADRLRMAAGFLESGVRLDPRDMVALADEVDVLEARIEALTKAICDELCECGSFLDSEVAEHDQECPYSIFMAALAAKEER